MHTDIYGCLVYRLFRRRSKKTSKLCVTALCAGNSPVTGEFPAQRASSAENGSIWWRHDGWQSPPCGNVRPVPYCAGSEKLLGYPQALFLEFSAITMTSQWTQWRLKSHTSRLFTHSFIQGADQRKHQSSASLAFVRWPVNSPYKGPVARKMFPFDDSSWFHV